MSKPSIDPSCKQAIVDIQAGKSTRWVVMGYEKQSDRIIVVEKGDGGIDEVQEEMNDGKVLFAYIRYDITGIARYLFIGWCGEGVQGMRKGNYTAHSKEIEAFCKPTHASINARNEKDIDDKSIVKLLTKAMGANYDAGGRIQGSTGGGSRKEEVKTIDNFVVAKDDSAAYWAEEKKREEDRKVTEAERLKSEKARLEAAQKEEAANISAKWDSMKPAKLSNAAPAAKSTPAPAAPARAAAPPPAAPARAAAPPPAAPSRNNNADAERKAKEEADRAAREAAEEEERRRAQEEADAAAAAEAEAAAQAKAQAEADAAAASAAAAESYSEPVAAESEEGVPHKALFDYDAQEEGELTFKEGETIWVTNQDPGGWWTGMREDYTKGLFPGNYVGPME